MLFLFFFGAVVACQSDECVRLCTQVSNRIAQCKTDWSIEWAYLDGNSTADFANTCTENWDIQSSELEWRAIEEAHQQCGFVLESLNNDEIDCNQLRAMYFYNP